MIQFNLNRFGKLAKWSLTNDKRYYVKSFLQILVIMLFGFLFFPILNKSSHATGYTMSSIMVAVIFLVTIVLGSSFMFYSMDNEHDRQNLMMLPASNFEKYLMRYATWILLIPLYLVAFFAADLLQYVIHWALGHHYVEFVTSTLLYKADNMSNAWHQAPADAKRILVNTLLFLAIWFHSIYALGATFFRSRKYNWVLTTIVIILLGVVQGWILPFDDPTSYKETTKMDIVISDVAAGLWIVLNFWLSYKLFCRTQVIGRFINL